MVYALSIQEKCRLIKCVGIFLVALCGACGNRGRTPDKAEAQDERAAMTELPLPTVPDSITRAEECADYIILHFWDEMDFNNTTLSLDSAFMEQNFVNYIQLYDYATAQGRTNGARRLLAKAGVSEEACRFVVDIAERYLTDPNSPMRHEEHFLPFIHAIDSDNVFSPAEKERLAYTEKRILKNRPGTIGADFVFVDRDGRHRRLAEAVKGWAYTLLLFYDYDCETCAGVEKAMMDDAVLNRAAVFGMLHIVAVNVFGDDLQRWKQQSASFPTGWTVGYSPGCEVVEKDIYSINAAPTLYLLDSGRRVILKDVSLQEVTAALERTSRTDGEREDM